MVLVTLPSSSVGSSCFLHSSSFSPSSPSSSPHSSLSSSSFHSSSPLSSELLPRAQSVLALPMSRHSTLPSQRAIVGREWSSSPSLVSYLVACTASVGTSCIPPNQNKLSVPAKFLKAEPCSSSTSS